MALKRQYMSHGSFNFTKPITALDYWVANLIHTNKSIEKIQHIYDNGIMYF